MIYDLKKDIDKKRFNEKVQYLLREEKLTELKEKRKIRTLKQNNYLHLICGWLGLELGYTSEEVKQDIYKRDWCKKFYQIQKKGRTVYRSTKDLNTLEMTNSIELFRNLSLMNAGVYLPAPNESVLIQQIKSEIDRFGNSQYI